jgi:opacity protein-like surface antigen
MPEGESNVKRKLFALGLLFVALPSVAADLSYNYIQGGYQEYDIDDDLFGGFDVDGDGYFISGSFELTDNWFVAGGYSTADFDFGIDLDELSVGAGYHVPLNNNVDFYGLLSLVRAEASVSGFGSEDESGYAAEIGIRGMIGDRFELNGSLAYVDLDDGGDGTAFGAGLLYNFTDSVAAGLAFDFDEDVQAFGVGVRVYF